MMILSALIHHHSGPASPSFIEQYGMLIVTLILAVITFLYLRVTNKMANIMKKEFDLRTTPIVELEFRNFERLGALLRLKYAVKNKGDSRVKLLSVSTEYFNELTQEQMDNPLETIDGRIILPPGHNLINLDHNFDQFPENWNVSTPGERLRFKLKLIFYFENALGDPFEEETERVVRHQ